MDLGDGVFVATSLTLAPGVPYAVLKQRLQQRLIFAALRSLK